MFTKMAHEAFMKLKQVRRRSWGGGGYHIYIYTYPKPHSIYLGGLYIADYRVKMGLYRVMINITIIDSCNDKIIVIWECSTNRVSLL